MSVDSPLFRRFIALGEVAVDSFLAGADRKEPV
jgi:hypothetical protein